MPTKKRTTRTKQETQDQFENVQRNVQGREKLSPREQELKTAQDQSTRGAVQGLKVETVLGRITTVGLDAQRALSTISEQLAQQTQLLNDVQKAVELAKAELEEIHDKDVAASAIEDLIESYTTKETELNQTMTEFEANLEKRRSQLLEELRQQAADLKIKHDREEVEYVYARDKKRRGEDDMWTAAAHNREIAERDRQEQLAKNWAQREEALKLREKEFLDFKAQVEAFPVKLDAEIKKAVAINEASIKREFHHQIELMTKDSEAAKRESDSTQANLRATIDALKVANVTMEQRLAQVDDKVKSIAEKALEAAGSKSTLAEFQMLQSGRGDGQGRGKSA